MSVLKILRESRNLAQADLAKKINASTGDLEDWEKNPKSVPKYRLSDLAYHFGLSSEDLIDAINGHLEEITTSNYYIFADKNLEDGWWGHFGIRVSGQPVASYLLRWTD